MKLLITGASGMLGYNLMGLACAKHEVWGSYGTFPVAMTGAQTFAMELRDEALLRSHLMGLRPDAIVHTAAFTDVNGCEKDHFMARQINVQTTKILAMLAGELEASFVYISTDYVFDGKKGDYTESDAPCPLNVYGETKLLGEEAVRSYCPNALIIRTSIFGVNIQPKTGLVEYVMTSLARGEPFTRFSDQFSTPIYTADLSRLILALLDQNSTGLFHIGGGEKISRYDFALKVAELFSLPRDMIRSVPFEQLKGLPARPRDSSLYGEKLENFLGVKLPKIAEGLERLKHDQARNQKLKEKR